MAEPWKEATAVALIVGCVLVKNLRHSETTGCGDDLDAEVACHAGAEGIHSASPFGRRVRCLLESCSQGSVGEGEWAKRIKFELTDFFRFCGGSIRRDRSWARGEFWNRRKL